MNDSLNLADFLFVRIRETIDYKQYISEVSIDYRYAESYGNEYIQVSYTIQSNESFKDLAYNEERVLFLKSPNYTFSLSTNREKYKYNEKRKLLRIIEFRYIYESLASYAVLQFEEYLNQGTAIKVKGIDLWPEANYAEKYLLTDLEGRYRRVMHSDFGFSASRWSDLHQLAKKAGKMYKKEKDQFSITDIEINNLFGLGLDSIQFILLDNDVPIKIKGIKTIDEIYIHAAKLAEALKKEINSESVWRYNTGVYKKLLTYLYDNYLTSEKISIIKDQQLEFLKYFIIQKGDILQLNSMRIVMANSVSVDQKGAINVEYTMLKTDLQPGERTRIIKASDILYILKQQHFLEFMNQIPVKRLSHLSRWMLKRKMKLDFKPFEPDLTKEIDDPIRE